MEQFEYKVGDYVYCHTDRYFCGILLNKKGHKYKIKFIRHYLKKDELHVAMESEDISYCSVIDFGCWIFNNNEIEANNEHMLFYTYFLSKQEYRKLKFKKLDERI